MKARRNSIQKYKCFSLREVYFFFSLGLKREWSSLLTRRNLLKMDNIRPRAQIKFVACWWVYPKWARYERILCALTFSTHVWTSLKSLEWIFCAYLLFFFDLICVKNIYRVFVRGDGPCCTLKQCPCHRALFTRVSRMNWNTWTWMNANMCDGVITCL